MSMSCMYERLVSIVARRRWARRSLATSHDADWRRGETIAADGGEHAGVDGGECLEGPLCVLSDVMTGGDVLGEFADKARPERVNANNEPLIARTSDIVAVREKSELTSCRRKFP